MPNDQPANGRRSYQRNVLILKVSGQHPAEFFRLNRVLQDEGALQILRAVKTAGQHKVAFEQRAGNSKFFNYFLILQLGTPIDEGILVTGCVLDGSTFFHPTVTAGGYDRTTMLQSARPCHRSAI